MIIGNMLGLTQSTAHKHPVTIDMEHPITMAWHIESNRQEMPQSYKHGLSIHANKHSVLLVSKRHARDASLKGTSNNACECMSAMMAHHSVMPVCITQYKY